MTKRAPVLPPEEPSTKKRLPLQSGDCLSAEEFWRRYEGMPELKKAELIEGVVYVASAVNYEHHGNPHVALSTWLGHYWALTPGVSAADNSTVRMDKRNVPQPDLFLHVLPTHGGQSRITEDGYIEGAPELVAEVAATRANYDLHSKKEAYRRNGVREYVVWRVLDREIDWFILRASKYERLLPARASLMKSEVFPGLWLDVAALLRKDMAAVIKVLDQGLATPEHSAFVSRLERQARGKR